MDEARRNQLDVLEDIDENTEGNQQALGAPSDTAATSDTGNFTLTALMKRLLSKIPVLGQKTAAGSQSVVLASDTIPLVAPSNVNRKFREAFEDYTPNGALWTEVKGNGDIIVLDGNAVASSYLVISKDPLSQNTLSSIESVDTYDMPLEFFAGLSLSQRTLGQEFAVELVSTDAPTAMYADIAISNISQATTTLTINTTAAHGLVPGKRIGISGSPDARLNYPSLVVASVPSTTQLTCTAGPGGTIPSLTVGPINGGVIYGRASMGGNQDGSSMIFENSSATNASVFVRSNSGDVFPSGAYAGNHSSTILTSASAQAINSAYTYAFLPTTEYRLSFQGDKIQWTNVAVDSTSISSAIATRTQVVPNPSKKYKIRFRAINNKSYTVPSAKIVSISKSGTTTATITTDQAHGLVVGDPYLAYGVRDQTNFPNGSSLAVASVISPTQFTAVWGGAVTATSYGGFVAKILGQNSTIGAYGQVLSNATLTTDASGKRVLTVTGNTTWSSVAVGDYVNIHGARVDGTGADLGIDGAWKLRNIVSATVLEFEALPGWTPPANFASTNCGGGMIRRTDLRISYVRLFDFERNRVEFSTRPNNDSGSALAVAVTNGLAATVAQGTSASSGSGWVFKPDNGTVADVASASVTSTATATPSTNPAVAGGYASFQINVSAVSGSGAYMDLSVEESDDGGTNWMKVYDFPRITASGFLRSPPIMLTGNRLRYVQTVGGTSPSITRTISRVTEFNVTLPIIRLLRDRALAVNTLNSATAALRLMGANNAQLVMNMGAATTAPTIKVQGSEDGTNWYDIPGATLVATANSVTQMMINNVMAEYIRAVVSSAGSAATMNELILKAMYY